MKSFCYNILILLICISCGDGNNETSGDLISSDTIKICSNKYFDILKSNDSLICFKKNGILTKTSLKDTLFISINKTDSLLYVNDQIINLFNGRSVTAQSNETYRSHSKYCSSNDIIEIYPFGDQLLVVNNYTRSDVCYTNPIQNHLGEDSIIWEDGIGSALYYNFSDGFYNSGVFDTKKDLYRTNNDYVSFQVIEDVLIGFHYFKQFDSTYNYEFARIIYESFRITDTSLIKLNTDTSARRSYSNERHPFIDLVVSSSEVLGDIMMLDRELYGIKKNNKWQLFAINRSFQYNISALVCEATDVDTVFKLSFDKSTYLGTRGESHFLFTPSWKGNKKFEFQNLIVSKYVAPAINPSNMYDYEYFIYSMDGDNYMINTNKNRNRPWKIIESGNPLDSLDIGDKNILNPEPDTIFKYPIENVPYQN
ncbi:MAG: hypothetical protein ACI8ZM_003839 [Crocinitomix sp.]|jgi:hypothetical protein